MLFHTCKKASTPAPIADLQEVLNQFNRETSCTGGVKTIPISRIEYFLEKYKEFSKIPTTDKLYNSQLSDFKGNIEYQYFRHFGYLENFSKRATTFEELLSVIQEVEDKFDKKIHEAHSYLGTCLEGDFHFGMLVSEQFEPHSIAEILNRESHQWCDYTIDSGYPQPIYQNRYNKIVKEAIKRFVTK